MLKINGFHRSSIVLFGGLACIATTFLPTKVSSEEPQKQENLEQSQSFSTQCLHAEHGLKDCTVERGPQHQYTVHWQDGSQYQFRFKNNTVEFWNQTGDRWQEVQQAGLCWAQRCFKADIGPLNILDQTQETLEAVCLNVEQDDSDCTIEHVPEFNGGRLSWADGRQEYFNPDGPQLLYAFEKAPEQWMGPVNPGLCADKVCVLELPQ